MQRGREVFENFAPAFHGTHSPPRPPAAGERWPLAAQLAPHQRPVHAHAVRRGAGAEGPRALRRSAFFLIFFIVVHAIGNLHVFLGPDDFNGYGYFCGDGEHCDDRAYAFGQLANGLTGWLADGLTD